MRKVIIRIIVTIVIFTVQIMAGAVAFSVTKNVDGGRELGRVESADRMVQVRLIVVPSKPRLSDTIIFRLEVDADTAVKIDMPEFGNAIGTLKVLEINEEVNSVVTQKENRTLVIKTIPTQAGITPIWSMPITYYKRSEPQDKKNVIELNATSLEIDSAVTPDLATLDDLKSDYELLQIESNWFWRIIVIFTAVLGLVLLFSFWFFKRREKLESEPKLSPQQIALKRIAELLDKRLHEVDVKLFFVELAGVVRWYVEQQTSIRVPELTTEEFLKEISQNRRIKNTISNDLAKRLKLFLESADMVKFAKFKPNQEEIMQGIKYAQAFIIEWIN